MKDQKAENLLNLALSVPEEERKQTGELDVGYDRETRTWELIVKYSGDLAGIMDGFSRGGDGTGASRYPRAGG